MKDVDVRVCKDFALRYDGFFSF